MADAEHKAIALEEDQGEKKVRFSDEIERSPTPFSRDTRELEPSQDNQVPRTSSYPSHSPAERPSMFTRPGTVTQVGASYSTKSAVKQYLKSLPQDRKERAKREGLCFKCLEPGHRTTQCPELTQAAPPAIKGEQDKEGQVDQPVNEGDNRYAAIEQG